MAKLSELTTHRQMQQKRRLNDPATADEANRLEMASAVSLAVVKYRAEHNLTQTEFAANMGWRQPSVARLERGDHQPSLATLERLARAGIITVRLDQAGTFVERQPA